MGKIKTIAKKALKATPPGMMITAGKKALEEFKRLTKPKKPGGRAPSKKRPSKPKDPNAPKKPGDIPAAPRRPKVKDPRRPRKAPPKVIRDRRNRRKK